MFVLVSLTSCKKKERNKNIVQDSIRTNETRVEVLWEMYTKGDVSLFIGKIDLRERTDLCQFCVALIRCLLAEYLEI